MMSYGSIVQWKYLKMQNMIMKSSKCGSLIRPLKLPVIVMIQQTGLQGSALIGDN